MFPIDTEFLILYFFYLLLGVVLLFGSFFSKTNKTFFKRNFLAFIFYTCFFIYVFLDKSNFEGGSSLVILFYSGLIISIHFVIVLLSVIYISKITNRK